MSSKKPPTGWGRKYTPPRPPYRPPSAKPPTRPRAQGLTADLAMRVVWTVILSGWLLWVLVWVLGNPIISGGVNVWDYYVFNFRLGAALGTCTLLAGLATLIIRINRR